ncbi:MAG: hypothetical protein GWN87_24910 [Desulfuromonadales bacterium]|nr:hypothetical protein [Desulfuromonadales bacterium]
MKALLVTALVELGAELVSTYVDKRRQAREIARLDRERRERERELLRKRTADRIRLAKLKYWKNRETDEQFRARLDAMCGVLKRELDENPYLNGE